MGQNTGLQSFIVRTPAVMRHFEKHSSQRGLGAQSGPWSSALGIVRTPAVMRHFEKHSSQRGLGAQSGPWSSALGSPSLFFRYVADKRRPRPDAGGHRGFACRSPHRRILLP